MKLSGDRVLVQIVDQAMAESARLSGAWLACRPGCFECCIGPFAITQLDAIRLRQGLAEMEAGDKARADRVRARAAAWMERNRAEFPGDPVTGILGDGLECYADEEPCPALDPESRTCDLYAWRPLTCRTFGPPVRLGEESLAICELCFRGASDAEIAACEVEIDPDGVEAALLDELEREGVRGDTIVAWALRG